MEVVEEERGVLVARVVGEELDIAEDEEVEVDDAVDVGVLLVLIEDAD
jgi:hypothetical protein